MFANEKSSPLDKGPGITLSKIQSTSPTAAKEQFKDDLEDKDHFDNRVGKTVVVFSEFANFYEHASEKSKVLGTLSIGKTVKVLALMAGSSKKNGFEDKWLKIENSQDGKISNAYIWGGDLVISKFDFDEKNQLLVGIVGMEKPSDPNSYKKIAEARVINGGKIISRESFTPLDGVLSENRYYYNVSAEKIIDKGFLPNVTIVALKFEYGESDYPNGDILFTWSGNQFKIGPQVEETNSLDYAYFSSYKYILPNDPGGVHNCITIKYTDTPNVNEESLEGVTVSKKNAAPSKDTFLHYAWNGEKLIEAKKCGK
jgi:hypothetical protein